MEERKVINIIRKEKQNSLELGKANRRIKLYFQDFDELDGLLKRKIETDKLIDKLLSEE